MSTPCAGGSVIWEPFLAVAVAAGTPCGGFALPVRALARRASDGSGLDRIETRPVVLVGRGWDVWEEGGEAEEPGRGRGGWRITWRREYRL